MLSPQSRCAAPRRVDATYATLAVLALVAGCGTSSAEVTCRDYGVLGDRDRGQVIADLLRQHGLDADAVVNQVALAAAVDGHCGTGPVPPTLRNADDPVDRAVDWSAATW